MINIKKENMAKEALENEKVEEVKDEDQKPATEDKIKELESEDIYVNDRHLLRYQYAIYEKGKVGRIVREQWREKIGDGEWQKIPGEVTIEEVFATSKGKEQRVVSYWKLAPNGKDMLRYLRIEEKKNGKWEIVEGMEKALGEITIEETLIGPSGEEQRMVSYWKPAPNGKLHRYLCAQQRRESGGWEAIPGTEQDMGSKPNEEVVE